jgi:hypothetical protein
MRQVRTGFGALATQAPSADAEQSLDPIHALTRDDHMATLSVALHGDDRAAEGVVVRDKVATWAGADEWRVGGGRGGMDAVVDMQRAVWVVKHLGGSSSGSFGQSAAGSDGSCSKLQISFGEC